MLDKTPEPSLSRDPMSKYDSMAERIKNWPWQAQFVIVFCVVNQPVIIAIVQYFLNHR